MSFLLQLLIAVYIAGAIIAFLFVIKKFIAANRLKELEQVDLFKIKPEMRPYLIRKVLFWPYYLLVEKNPVSIISELFFSRYGNKHRVYWGEHGIKNFVNDLIKGKTRYKRYQVNVYWIKLDEQSEAYQDYIQYHDDKHQMAYARVLLAKPPKRKDRYLLMIYRMPASLYDPNENEQSITRFDLDECCRVNAIELKESLSEISPELTKEVLGHF